MSTTQFDAIVIGAGAGGLFTAALLAHRGYRTLVVERLDKVGGRASTDDIDGFKVNNGAIVIEVIFDLPGMGQLILGGVTAGDTNLVQGVTITIALTFVIVNTIVDLLYLVVNPRIRTV